MNKLAQETLSVEMPYVFDQIKGEDANYEYVTSSTIQPVRLFYQHKMVSRKIAVVFVTTENNGQRYTDAHARGEIAQEIFEELLEFDEVKVFTDQSKGQIIEQFDHLDALSNDFEKSKAATDNKEDVLLIGIFWIGQKLRTSYAPNLTVLN